MYGIGFATEKVRIVERVLIQPQLGMGGDSFFDTPSNGEI